MEMVDIRPFTSVINSMQKIIFKKSKNINHSKFRNTIFKRERRVGYLKKFCGIKPEILIVPTVISKTQTFISKSTFFKSIFIFF